MHFFASTDQEKEEYRKDMKTLAKTYRDYIHFTIVDAQDHADMLPTVGLKEGAKTGLSFVDPVNGDIFPFREHKINSASVELFLADINADKIKPWTGNTSFGDSMGHDEL